MALGAESNAFDDMEIAPGYTVRDWKALDLSGEDSGQWAEAVRIFETRLRRRFIEPVDVLIAHEIGLERGAFGFSILAIDCVLVETLQGFAEGVVDHTRKSGQLTRAFLSQGLAAWFDDGDGAGSKAGKFYKHCRCAIHHSGQTDGDFRLRRSGVLIEFDGDRVTVNRTAFHEALKSELDAYLKRLVSQEESTLRANFRKKMDAVCGIDPGTA